MKGRIRIVTTGTYPHGMASTYRIHCYAKGLVEQGVSLDVMSAKALFRYAGRMFNYRSVFDGVPFTVLLNTRPFSIKWLVYVWAEIESYLLLFHCLLTIRRYDVLLVYGMGVVPRLLLIPVLHLFGKKVVLELNEYPYSTQGSKITRIPIVRRALEWSTLRLVFPRVDGFLVISERLREVVSERAPSAMVLKVPILLDPSRADGNLHPGAEADRVPDNPYIFHAGSLSEQKDGIIKLVEAYSKAAIELRKRSVHLELVLTNKRALPEIWTRICQTLKASDLEDRLRITGYLTESELHGYLRNSAVLLLNKPTSFQNKYNFPTKLGDYLLSGRPVVVACEGTELNNYLKDTVNSRVFSPDDVEGMARAAVDFCLNEVKADSIGQAGRRLAIEEFSYRKNAPKIKAFLEAL